MIMNEVKQLQKILQNSNSIVFFGGAGVSTESGIPDFRSKGGLYNQKYDNTPPENILSHIQINFISITLIKWLIYLLNQMMPIIN